MHYNRNNIKISFRDDNPAEFFVNEKKRTIACKLTGHLIFPWGGFSSHIGCPDEVITAVAVAKCHENDTFDVNRGKRVALAKAENEVYSKAIKRTEELHDELAEYLRFLSDFVYRGYECCAQNVDYVISISDKTDPAIVR